jgi:hypothetical protein
VTTSLLFPAALLIAALAPTSAAERFTGVITDNECPGANHALMKMGDTDPECVKACIDEHGATYLLYDGKVSYTLSDQKTPAAFAGKRVVVTGTLDAKAKTIHVESIAAAR